MENNTLDLFAVVAMAFAAIAAIGSALAAWYSHSQAKNLFEFSKDMHEANSVREIKSLWHQYDLTVLDGSDYLKSIIGQHHYGIEDNDMVTRRYIVFAVLNIAHSLYHYRRLDHISEEFEQAQLLAVTQFFEREEEIVDLLLSEEYGCDKSFVDYIKHHIEANQAAKP